MSKVKNAILFVLGATGLGAVCTFALAGFAIGVFCMGFMLKFVFDLMVPVI